MRGDHQAANAAAAVATAVCAGVGFDAALAGVAGAEGSRLRAELWRTPSGLRVLNDSYNANPDLDGGRPAQPGPARRPEAGGGAGRDGRARRRQRRRPPGDRPTWRTSLGIEVVAVGGAPYGGAAVASQDEALDLVEDLPPDSVVLLKASRSVGLDRLAERLREGVGAR